MSGNDGSGTPSRYCPTPHQMPVPAASPPPPAQSPMMHSSHNMPHGHHLHGSHTPQPMGYYNYNPQNYYSGYYGMQQQPLAGAVQQPYAQQQPQWSPHVHQPNPGYYQPHQGHSYGTHGGQQQVHQNYPTQPHAPRPMHSHHHTQQPQALHHAQPARTQQGIPIQSHQQQHIQPHALPTAEANGISNLTGYDMNTAQRPSPPMPIAGHSSLQHSGNNIEPGPQHALMNLSMFVNQNQTPPIVSPGSVAVNIPVPLTSSEQNLRYNSAPDITLPEGRSASSSRDDIAPTVPPGPQTPKTVPIINAISEQQSPLSPVVSSSGLHQASESPKGGNSDGTSFSSGNGGQTGMMPVRLQNMGQGARTKASMRKMMQEQQEKTVPGSSAPESDTVDEEEPPRKKPKRKYKERQKVGNDKVVKEKTVKGKPSRAKTPKAVSPKRKTSKRGKQTKVAENIDEDETDDLEIDTESVTPKRSLRRSVSRSPAQAAVPVPSNSGSKGKKTPRETVESPRSSKKKVEIVSPPVKKRGRKSKKEQELLQNESNNFEEEIAFALLDLKTGKGSPEKRTRDVSEFTDSDDVTSIVSPRRGKSKQLARKKEEDYKTSSQDEDNQVVTKRRGRKPKISPKATEEEVEPKPAERSRRGRPPKLKSPASDQSSLARSPSPKPASKPQIVNAERNASGVDFEIPVEPLPEPAANLKSNETISVSSAPAPILQSRMSTSCDDMDFPVIHIPEVASGAPLLVQATVKDKSTLESTRFVYEGSSNFSDLSILQMENVMSPPKIQVDAKIETLVTPEPTASKKKGKTKVVSEAVSEALNKPALETPKRKYTKKTKPELSQSETAAAAVTEVKVKGPKGRKNAKLSKTNDNELGETVTKPKRKSSPKKNKQGMPVEEPFAFSLDDIQPGEPFTAETVNPLDTSFVATETSGKGKKRSSKQKSNKDGDKSASKKEKKPKDTASKSPRGKPKKVDYKNVILTPPRPEVDDDTDVELPDIDIDFPTYTPVLLQPKVEHIRETIAKHSTPIPAGSSSSGSRIQATPEKSSASPKKSKLKTEKPNLEEPSIIPELPLKGAKRKYTKKGSKGLKAHDETPVPVSTESPGKKSRKRKQDVSSIISLDDGLNTSQLPSSSRDQSDNSLTAEKGSESDFGSVEQKATKSKSPRKTKAKRQQSEPPQLDVTLLEKQKDRETSKEPQTKKKGRPSKGTKLEEITKEAGEGVSRVSTSVSTKRERKGSKSEKNNQGEELMTPPRKKVKMDKSSPKKTPPIPITSPNETVTGMTSAADLSQSPKKKGRPRKNSTLSSPEASTGPPLNSPLNSKSGVLSNKSPTANRSSVISSVSPFRHEDFSESPRQSSVVVEDSGTGIKADQVLPHKPKKRLTGIARELAEAQEIETIMEVSRAYDAPLPPLEFFYKFEYSLRSNYPPSTPKAKKLSAEEGEAADSADTTAVLEDTLESPPASTSAKSMVTPATSSPKPSVAKKRKKSSVVAVTSGPDGNLVMPKAPVKSKAREGSQSPPKTVSKKKKSGQKDQNVLGRSSSELGGASDGSEIFDHLTFIPALAQPLPKPTIFVASSSKSRGLSDQLQNSTTEISQDDKRKSSGKKDSRKSKNAEKQAGPSLKVLDGFVKFYRGSDEEDISAPLTASKSKRPAEIYDPSVPWLCVFCGLPSQSQRLGDLFGPYYTNADLDKLEDITEGISHAARGRKSGMLEYSRQAKLKDKKETWFHEDCALWAGGVIPIGYSIRGLDQAVYDASRTKCSICRNAGATIGCIIRGCHQAAHVPCARRLQWTLDEETFHSFCDIHRKF